MKKFLLLGTVLVASTAWAFGGIGLGVKSSSHKGGVSSIGVHINGKGKADIDILEPCPEGLERNTDNTCTVCANGNVYLSYNVGAECDTPFDMNQRSCDEGCWCCDESRNQCVAPDPSLGGCAENGSTYCISNQDCVNENNTFCYVLSSDDDCESFDTGSCISMGEVEIIGDFIKSSFTMNWKSAENWCWAHGRQLVSLTDLGLSAPDNYYCSNEDCGISMETWENLRSTFGEKPFWFERYDSCESWLVNFEYNSIGTSDSIDPSEYALCK